VVSKPRKRQSVRVEGSAATTRNALIELAADLFAENGYMQTSIRDVARRGSLTTGAIYGNFRNKADLLAEAINLRIRQQLESVGLTDPDHTHVDRLRINNQAYPLRRQLRALLIQGGAAAGTDPETRERIRQEQLSRIDAWVARYEGDRERLGIDPSVDVRTAVLYTWAAEIGLGVLEAIGIEPTSPEAWADMSARPSPATRTNLAWLPLRRRRADADGHLATDPTPLANQCDPLPQRYVTRSERHVDEELHAATERRGLVADLQKQRDAALAKINRVLADVGVGRASRRLGSPGC
jgi:TetR/AcrR family acrAB operon transcriptional repressor